MHRFSWLKDSEIGQLPHEWNWLAGWYKEPNGRCVQVIHYRGRSWFKEYERCEYAVDWLLAEKQYNRKKVKN